MVFHPVRRLRRILAISATSASLAAASIVGVAGIAVLTAQPALAASTATGGSGASLPYAEVLAQNSPTTGTVIGPSYTQGQLADEAVGREAVTLAGNGSGQYVTFTTPVATNSIDFRYSIPDSSDGSVYTAPLSLYINGTKQTDFTLTNAYSWYYGSYPFVNTPSSGTPMHFYDEVHRLFTTTYPAGTTFKLEVDSEDTASSYTINLADFENVAAPLTQPAGSISVVSEGADPTGVNDSTAAFNAAIAAAGAAARSGSRRAPTTSRATSSSTTSPSRAPACGTRPSPVRRRASTATASRATPWPEAPTCTCRTSRSSATSRFATTAPRSTASAAR